MSEQYRVIADREHDDVYAVKREPFDRVTYGALGHDIVRIERPVPATDEPAEQDDPWIFDDTRATARERAQMLRAVARAPREDDALTIRATAVLTLMQNGADR